MNEQEFAELAAGHALHALSPEDAEAFGSARRLHPEWEHHVEADAVCAEGYATLVWYDVTEQKSVPLPEQIRTACGV